MLSPKELAAAIGVSESSIKRWVDEGLIEAHRTAGGHRRIALADAVRFLRTTPHRLAEPERLGLPESLADRAGDGADWPDDAGERLYRLLEAGAAAAARGLLMQLYVQGFSPAEICDGPLRFAMARIGHLWTDSSMGIMVEHRATEICQHAVQQLRALIPEKGKGPLALGGTPSPDPSQLPSLAAAAVLAEEGFRAVNLGPDLPLAVLGDAVLGLRPALVWVSLSHPSDAGLLEQDLAELYEKARLAGAAMAVGGLSAPRCAALSAKPRFLRGQSMAELVAFVRGLGLIR
jgi:excisionase family DNA binding protein